jgi:hypothetical protein
MISCYHEDKLKSSLDESGSGDRFGFPQGTNTWDATIQELYDDYGITLIYKGITAADLNRSWTSATANYSATELSDAEVEYSVNFLKNKVLRYINPDLMHKLWKPYWFLLKDYYNGSNPTQSNTGGMDFWATCLYFTWDVFVEKEAAQNKWLTTCVIPKDLDSLTTWEATQGMKYLSSMIQSMIVAKRIVPSDEYEAGFDYSTAIHNRTAYTEAYKEENFCWNRGFVSGSTMASYIVKGQSRPSSLSSANPWKPNMTVNQGNFYQYILLGMNASDADLEKYYPRDSWPFLRGKLDIVIELLKKTYRIDLRAIQAGEEPEV